MILQNGSDEIRTHDLCHAKAALSQLSYGPKTQDILYHVHCFCKGFFMGDLLLKAPKKAANHGDLWGKGATGGKPMAISLWRSEMSNASGNTLDDGKLGLGCETSGNLSHRFMVPSGCEESVTKCLRISWCHRPIGLGGKNRIHHH